MGFGGISIWQLLIVLGIIILIFGTKKLRNIGGDLGNAVKGFKEAVKTDEQDQNNAEKKSVEQRSEDDDAIDVTAERSSQTSDDKSQR